MFFTVQNFKAVGLSRQMNVSLQVWSDPSLYSHAAAKKSANMERIVLICWQTVWKFVCVNAFQLCHMAIKRFVWWTWDSNTLAKNECDCVCSVWDAFLLVPRWPFCVSREGKIVFFCSYIAKACKIINKQDTKVFCLHKKV